MAYITGNTGEWEYVIGLEVHAQVSSKAKLFPVLTWPLSLHSP